MQSLVSKHLPDLERRRSDRTRGRKEAPRERSPIELTSEESLNTTAPPVSLTPSARQRRKTRAKRGCSLCPADLWWLTCQEIRGRYMKLWYTCTSPQNRATGNVLSLIAGDRWPALEFTYRGCSTFGKRTSTGLYCRRTSWQGLLRQLDLISVLIYVTCTDKRYHPNFP